MTNGKPNGTTKVKTTWLIPLISAALAVVVAVAVLTTQWQTTLDATNQNEKDIANLVVSHESDLVKMRDEHEADIARLDESNRSRRNDIASLEERIAVVETQVELLLSARDA